MGSAVDEIAVKLGVQAGDLKAAMADANVTIKKFGQSGSKEADGLSESVRGISRGFREMRELVLGGGMVEGLNRFFDLAIKSAQASTDATDQNAAAVRRFADGWEELKGGVGGFAVFAVGSMNRVGEAIGGGIVSLKAWLTDMATGGDEAKRSAEIALRSAEAAEAQEHRFAEEKKKYGTELTQLTQQINAERQKGLDLARAQESPEQHLAALQADIAKQQAIIADAASNVVQRRQAELAILKDQNEALTVQANIEKERRQKNIDANKQALDVTLKTLDPQQRIKLLTDDIAAGEAIITAEKRSGANVTVLEANQKDLIARLSAAQADAEAKRVENAKKIAGSAQEEVELLQLQLRTSLGIATGPEEAQLQILQAQRAERANQVELEDLAEKAISGKLTPAEQTRFKVLTDQKVQLDQQLALAQQLESAAKAQQAADAQVLATVEATTAEYSKQVEAASQLSSFAGSGSPLGLHNLGSYSSESLQEKLTQLQNQYLAGKMQWEQAGYNRNASVSGSTYENSNYYLASQIDSVKNELAFRQKIQTAFASGGRSAALSAFESGGGDPLSFDTVLANMNSWNQGNSQTNNQLGQISGTLAQIGSTLQTVFKTPAVQANKTPNG